MNQSNRIEAVRAYLAGQLGCAPDGLSGQGTLYVSNPADGPFIRLAVLGERIIVSASPELLPEVKRLTAGRSRDEIFELPLVYGQTIHYVPGGRLPALPLPEGYHYRLLEGEALGELAGLTGFPNSLAFDEDGHTGTGIAFFATDHGKVIGLAGAGPEGEGLWEMGVDVDPAYRGRGLASALVARLTRELLDRGRTPFYSASVTNIGSQAVAGRCGLMPCWMDTYSNVLRDDYIYKDNFSFKIMRKNKSEDKNLWIKTSKP